MVQVLLDCGADRAPVDGQSTPLHSAAFWGKVHIIKALLTLISNSKVGDEETLVAEQLALATKMINTSDKNNRTPLQLARRVGAVGFGNQEVIVPLLDGKHIHELEPLIRQNVKKELERHAN